VLQQTVDALNRINRIMSDDNIRSFSTSLRNIEAVTGELDARKDMFARLDTAIGNANLAVEEYQKLGADARALLNTDGREALANINKATEEARLAITAINRSATELEEPLNDFGTTTLPQVNDAVRQLDTASRSLNDLIDSIRQSPRQFISRPAAKELEVQP